MNNIDKQAIRKLQATLIKIDSNIPCFFNIVQYESLGLVYSTEKHGKDASGNDVVIGTRWHLTDKAKQYIKVAI